MNDGQDARSATGLPVAGQVAVSRVQLAAALLGEDRIGIMQWEPI